MSQPDLTGILDTIGAAVVIVDVEPEGRFICRSFNKTAEEYYANGLAPEKFVGCDVANFDGYSEPQVQRAINNYRRCVEAREQISTESRDDFPDGSYRWGRHTYVPSFDDSGEVCQITITSIEVTELRRTKQDLTATLDRIGSPITIIDVAPEGRFFWRALNKPAEEYYGFTHKQVAGRELNNFAGLTERDIRMRQRAIDNYHRCIAARQPVFSETRQPVFSETRQDFADDSFRWGRHTFVPIFADNGEVHRIMVTSIDITELKETQHDLLEIMDRTGAPISIVDVTPAGRFILRKINKAAEEYFGLEPDQYIGDSVGDLNRISKQDVSLLQRASDGCRCCVEARETIVKEFSRDFPDGSFRWGRHTFVPIFSVDGEVHRIMVTSIDITELKETQDKLENALTRVLSGFVTICATCKDIKEDPDKWVRVEHYLDNDANDVKFSHAYCPKCYESAVQELK